MRTELLVFITPKVVETDDELRALSVEMRDRMRGITDFSDVPIELESLASERDGRAMPER